MMKPLTDALELQRLSDGDLEAFWGLWDRHRAYVTSLCRHWLRKAPDDIDDAVGDTMVETFRSLPRCAGEMGNLRAWLRRVAFHVCARRWGEQRVHLLDIPDLEHHAAAAANFDHETPQDAVFQTEMRERLMLLIQGLPAHLRDPLCLSAFNDMPCKMIGARLGISEVAVHNRLREGRVRLRRVVDDCSADGVRCYTPNVGPLSLPAMPVADPWRAAGTPHLPGVVAAAQRPSQVEDKTAQTRLVPVALPSGAVADFHVLLDRKLPRRDVRASTLEKYIRQHPGGWRKRLELADLLYASGRWERAAKVYREVLAAHPQCPDVWQRLGEILRLTGRTAEASRVYREALPHAETPAERLVLRGSLEACRERNEVAAEHFQRAAQIEPTKASHLHALAGTYLDCERPLAALKACDQALRLDPDDVVALTQSYVPLLHLGRCREIEHRLTRAVETHPDDVRALSLLAKQRAATFRVRGAEGAHTRQLIARALRLSPDAAEPTDALARFHLSRGEWTLALTTTRQFVESHPGHRDGWLCHAQVAFHTGDWQLAADSLLAALRLEPADIRAYSSAVEILGTAGRLSDLALTMDEMLRRFPKHWTAQGAACSAMLLHGRAGSEALELSARVLALQPRIPQVWFLRAGCLSQAGQQHAALEAIREGRRQIPETGAEWYGALAALSAASLSRALGEETQGWLWQAVAEAREGAKAWNTVLGLDMEGRVWEALGDRKRALQAYRRAQTMYPGYLLGAVLSHKIGRLGASR